ncbi:MAG TPA: metal ABC transporter substrate-binding protein [Nocardioidaceae bacterium]|nr:metal ABC transporter substrate-binding protein [Nocardioidaceae bacterium]
MKSFPGTRLSTLAGVLAAPLLLAGCSGSLAGDSGGPRVVASFYALEYVAERVVGDHAEVVNLTSPGVEPHDLELTVRQTAEVSEADLVVYEKGLQPAVDEAVEQHGPERVVEVTEAIELAPLDPDEHADETDEEHAGHAASDVDLHFWLDPERMATLAEDVQRQMSEVDPQHAADYEANLEAFRKDLTEVDAVYAEGLADCEIDTVVVSHDAFGYLEKYGLRFESIAGLSPEAEPSAAHLAELARLIEDEGISTVFSETLASPAMAETLARDLGIETAVLDPVEGPSDESASQDYLSLMRSNLEKLRAANRCA